MSCLVFLQVEIILVAEDWSGDREGVCIWWGLKLVWNVSRTKANDGAKSAASGPSAPAVQYFSWHSLASGEQIVLCNAQPMGC